ncbi:hypothetical protein GCM10027046_02950 [Uliginosibacterium flavum]|uniref:Uncharacterized protein n=1 Tax=Uliginosibacterium flavum TaxID=1396831 RepID=A0ABV2THW7_9RHOO
MSSPITVGITADPFVTLLAAAAIRAGQAVAAGYAEADRLHAQHAGDRRERADAQAQASQQGTAALEQAATEAETRLAQLASLGACLGAGERITASQPVRPQATDQASLAAYVRALESLGAELQNILLTEAGQRSADTAGLGEALSEFMHLPDEAARTPSTRLLARMAHLGEVPAELAALAQEFDACLPGERADLLASELRLRVQQHLRAEQERAVHEATAVVIEQSLKDLGYALESVAHTLYVEGGVVHFSRPGWGDYMVRMRLDFKKMGANFNVIRAVDEGNNARSVADHLAEDRWCSEFPALISALEAKGVMFNVTRRVEPGDLPVQLVERSKLPRFGEEEEGRRSAAPQARSLPSK